MERPVMEEAFGRDCWLTGIGTYISGSTLGINKGGNATVMTASLTSTDTNLFPGVKTLTMSLDEINGTIRRVE
jgi:hypothetical protein